MRHRKSGRTLGRSSTHRRAMFSNMTAALIEHEKIETTVAKAKELRRIAEKTITWATSLGDLLTIDQEEMNAEQKARFVHHVRMARRVLKDREVLQKLFHEVGPRLLGRPGGYTRIVRLAETRRGDNAPMALIELLSAEEKEAESEAAE